MRPTITAGLLLATLLVLGACAEAEPTNPTTTPEPTSEAGGEAAETPEPEDKTVPYRCASLTGAARAKGQPLSFDVPTSDTLTYRSSPFQPAFSFEAPPSPYPFTLDFSNKCTLSMHSGERGGIVFIRIGSVVDPDSGEFVDAPKNLVEWLADHPNLAISERSEGRIGALEGDSLEVVVKGKAESPVADCPGCVPLFPMPDNEYFMIPSDVRQRWTVVDMEGMSIAAIVQAARSDFASVARDADQLLSSVRFATD